MATASSGVLMVGELCLLAGICGLAGGGGSTAWYTGGRGSKT